MGQLEEGNILDENHKQPLANQQEKILRIISAQGLLILIPIIVCKELNLKNQSFNIFESLSDSIWYIISKFSLGIQRTNILLIFHLLNDNMYVCMCVFLYIHIHIIK